MALNANHGSGEVLKGDRETVEGKNEALKALKCDGMR